jgi:hypothetical protein
MAQLAIARACPNDGTLVTYSGSYTDADLMGHCPCCKQSLSVANPSYVPPPAGGIPPEITAQVALLSPDAQATLLADLQALTAAQAAKEAAAAELAREAAAAAAEAAAAPVEPPAPTEPPAALEPPPIAATVAAMEGTSG